MKDSRSGRPRVTSAADDRRIVTTHLRDRFKTVASTAREWNNDISEKTVSRRLKSVGLLCRRPAKKSRLIDRHKRARLDYATRYRRYTQRQWSNVIFSDESPFPIEKQDMRKRVYRRVGERFADTCLPTVQDKRSVMVWGAISVRGKSDLIITQGNIDATYYQDQILTPGLLPLLNNLPNRDNIEFQHDGCTVHTARTTQAFLQANNINVMTPWPPKSPDLNPIENIWSIIGTAVRNGPNPPRNPAEMADALRREWDAIDDWTIRRLIFSMRRRCSTVINANGGNTKY